MFALPGKTVWVIALILVAGIIPILWYLLAMGGFSTENLTRDLVEGTYQEMSLFKQIMAVMGGFVIKPLHMVLSALVIWALIRMRSPDMIALRWGLFLFLLGEAFCAVNYLVFKHGSHITEYLHSYGMVVGFGFAFYAFMEGLDSRLLKFGAKYKKCAVAELCGKCVKFQPVACGARRVILVLLLVFPVLATLPLLVPLQPVSYDTVILGTPYQYTWPVLYQLFEGRYTPYLAILLFAVAFLAMFLKGEQPVPDAARLLASAGLGALSFSILRFFLKTIFSDNLVWADYWEELTELIFVLMVVAVLLTFHQQLFREVFPGGREITLRNILSG